MHIKIKMTLLIFFFIVYHVFLCKQNKHISMTGLLLCYRKNDRTLTLFYKIYLIQAQNWKVLNYA